MNPTERKELAYFMIITTVLNILIIAALIGIGIFIKNGIDSSLLQQRIIDLKVNNITNEITGINMSIGDIYTKFSSSSSEDWEFVTLKELDL